MPTRQFHLAPLGHKIAVSLDWDGVDVTVEAVAAPPPPPVFTVAPSITGTAAVGETLTGSDGTITGGTVSARAWLRDGVAISGATGSTYDLVVADVGADIAYRVTATGDGGTSVATSATVGPVAAEAADITAIAADGWKATATSPADPPSLATIAVTRSGFNTSAVAANHSDTFLLTKRVRQAFPDQGLFTTDDVAVSRTIYSTDTIAGVTNNSTLTSPKPKARYLMPQRTMHGNSMRVSVEAMHPDARLGQQVAAVKVRAVSLADAADVTPWLVIGAPSVSTICGDAHSVRAFEDNLDLTDIDPGVYYLETEVYPWTGGAASVRSSEDAGLAPDFGRFYFTKDVAKAAAPPVAYVNTGGDDETGVWSTTPATAAANKFATAKAAMEAIVDATDTGGICDGAVLYFDNGTHVLAGPAFNVSVPQECAALTLTRSPESTNRASVIIQFGSAAFESHIGANAARNGTSLTSPLTQGVMNFKDVTLDRTGASNLARTVVGTATVPMLYQFIDTDFDNNAQTSRFLNATDVAGAIYGMTLTGAGTGATWIGGAANDFIIQRGISCTDLNGAALDGMSVVGCSVSNPGQMQVLDNTKGFMVSYSSFHDTANTLVAENWASATVVERIGFLEVLVEFTNTADTNPSFALVTTSGSTRGMQFHHVTALGAQLVGRFNLAYDNQSSTASNEQTHENVSAVGCVVPQLNMKGDILREDADGADGNFAAVHGVGIEGLYSMYAANAPASEHPSYAGVNSSLGTSSTLVQDPEADLFENYQATTAPSGTLTAGSGGGNYAPAESSPLDGMVTTRLVSSLDLAGATRTLPAPSGAYA